MRFPHLPVAADCLGQRRKDLQRITYNSVVSVLKDGSTGVSVDRDHDFRCVHPHDVVNSPGDPEGKVEGGDTVFPDFPTWIACSAHPASPTARLTPTAPFRASARPSSNCRLPGSFMPLPPVTTTWASARSTTPTSPPAPSRTSIREEAPSVSTLWTSVSRSAGKSGLKLLGRKATSQGPSSTSSSA